MPSSFSYVAASSMRKGHITTRPHLYTNHVAHATTTTTSTIRSSYYIAVAGGDDSGRTRSERRSSDGGSARSSSRSRVATAIDTVTITLTPTLLGGLPYARAGKG